MSCSCQTPKGSFASEQDTWTKQSSLSMQNWDPYPELQNPNNCYEKYKSAGSKERFIQSMHCCGTTPYNNLDQTWGPQKSYSL